MTDHYRQISECRSCKSGLLEELLDLGSQSLPWFVTRKETPPPKAPLVLVKCGRCQLVQLKHTVNRNLLFKHFWYRSSISSTILDDLKDIGWKAARFLSAGDAVIDIGSNDGSLLRLISGLSASSLYGFEPAENVIGDSRKWAIIISDYFSASKCPRKAKLITAISVFYDLDDPVKFAQEVSEVLEDDGMFIVQQNYLGAMLKNVAYDNVCHEHLTYFGLQSFDHVLSQAGLKIVELEFNQINSGSFRAYIRHADHPQEKHSLVEHALTDRFRSKVERKRRRLQSFLLKHPNVGIYGASTRGATIAQYCGLDSHKILYAVDNNPLKAGTLIPGTDIEIHCRSDVISLPKYMLLLPYYLKDEIAKIEHDYVSNGGEFVYP